MGVPRLLADHIGNPSLYPKVIATDQSGTTTGVAGYEPWRAFRGSRNPYSFWQPGTPNILSYLQLQHPDQPRLIDMWALSYGHNLGGFPILIKGSNDGSTFATVVSATIPTVTGGLLTGANGVLLEDGSWAVVHTPAGFAYWRFEIPAMGSDNQPTIPYLQPGLSYQPVALYRPFSEHSSSFQAQETVSPLGWRGRGPRAFLQTATLNLRADADDFEYLRARFHIEEVFGSGRPMWVFMDQERATEGYCAIRPLGEQGFERPSGIYWPTAQIRTIEFEPNPVS